MGEIVGISKQPDVHAMVESAKITTDKDFIYLLQVATDCEVQLREIEVTSPQSLLKAVDSTGLLRRSHKEAEKMRLAYVTFPTKYTKIVNGMFKGIKDSLERSLKGLDKKIITYREVQEKEREAKISNGMVDSVPWQEAGLGEVEKIDMNMEEPPPLDSVVTGDSGAKIYTREEWDFEIKDMGKFTRAVGSMKTHVELLPEVLFELKKAPLLKLIRREEKPLRKIPGLKIFKKNVVVHKGA